MRILLVAHFFPPQRIGGAEKIAQVYAANLIDRGNTVQVVCAGDWDTGEAYWNGFEDEIYRKIPVRRINFNWAKAPDPNRYLYDNPVVEACLEEWLEAWKPDVVHIVSLLTLSVSVIRAAKKRGIPVVFTLVDFWLICPNNILAHGDHTLCDGNGKDSDCLKCMLCNSNIYTKIKSILPEDIVLKMIETASEHPWISNIRGLRGMAMNIHERRDTIADAIHQVDRIIAPSVFLENIMEQVLDTPATLIHYGHDLSWLENMPEKTPADCLRIGYIGQIIPLKGVHLLISAFQAAAANRSAQLLIYGDPHRDPTYTEQLRDMIGKDGNIHIVGPYAHDEIGEVLSHLDVIVVPSQWHENNPLVVQEAFASMTPVIGSNVGGISEFVHHGENGLLFEHDSVDDLRAQIERILMEPTLIRQMKSKIGEVKRISKEIDEIITIYQEILEHQEG